MINTPDLDISSSSLSLVFKGSVNYEVVDSIAQIISDRLEIIEDNINIRKKVFGILIESLQNLGNYIKELKHNDLYFEYDTSSIMFMIDTIKEGYLVVTGHFIQQEKAEFLKEKIEKIKSLSLVEMKNEYNEVLQSHDYNRFDDLPILDIALKSNGLIDCHLEKINEDLSFYCLKTTIQKV